jgi:enoyl-[acyl-carrier protein] reductase I
MNLLEGKKALVFGIANKRSIAWGISKALNDQGAEIGLSYATDNLERRVKPLAESIGAPFVEKCDVADDEAIEELFSKASQAFSPIDVLVHAVAFANREELEGAFSDTSREGFRVAMEISVFSFIALARAAVPLLSDNACLLTLSYYGGQKVVPNYNVMGVAKAALEATTRYLAADFGPRGFRVNAISAGPIRTLSAAGVSGFKKLYREFPDIAPLRRNIDISDIGSAAVWLASDLARNITGEVLFVDSGYNILGAPVPSEFDPS